MDEVKNYLNNAEIAFANQQYKQALSIYKKVIELSPNNLYALSRAGAISVSLKDFESAIKFFKKAIEIDPKNGDNLFNYASACLFSGNYQEAFNKYVEAESLGCSEDVLPQLYFQLALMSSMRNDLKSALIYFKKCEDSDKDGKTSIDPNFLSEKLKIYMALEDYDNALKCAAKLVASSPSTFKYYMVEFNILMSSKKLKKAEDILNQAEKYADLSLDDTVALVIERASLYIFAANQCEKKDRKQFLNLAISVLKNKLNDPQLTWFHNVNIIIALAETYQKLELHDNVINCLEFILNGVDIIEKNNPSNDVMEIIRYIYNNEVSKKNENKSLIISHELINEQRDHIYYILISSYLETEQYKKALELAKIFKHSNINSYAYYGRYAETFALRKLNSDDDNSKKVTAEAIAYFKNKMLTNYGDTLAAIFRARIYADIGDYDTANEIAELLAADDKGTILKYIDKVSKE